MSSPVILVIDTETTGFDPKAGAVVEFAACVVTPTEQGWAPIEAFSRLVHPGQPIPPESSAIHHIIDAHVADAPPLTRVLETFALWLAGRGLSPAVFVAHNAVFDKGFLEPLVARYPHVPWLCTMRLAHHLLPDLPSYSNQALRYRLEIDPQFSLAASCGGRTDPHSAAGDAIVTASLLCREMELARARFPDVRGLRQLVQYADQPYLITRMPFGKHKGEPFSDLPADYLDWLKRTTTDADMLFTIAQVLDSARP
ncbi:MAG: putative quorum-sensing-regulated virulence factor [Acidiferrobacter sp.]